MVTKTNKELEENISKDVKFSMIAKTFENKEDYQQFLIVLNKLRQADDTYGTTFAIQQILNHQYCYKDQDTKQIQKITNMIDKSEDKDYCAFLAKFSHDFIELFNSEHNQGVMKLTLEEALKSVEKNYPKFKESYDLIKRNTFKGAAEKAFFWGIQKDGDPKFKEFCDKLSKTVYLADKLGLNNENAINDCTRNIYELIRAVDSFDSEYINWLSQDKLTDSAKKGIIAIRVASDNKLLQYLRSTKPEYINKISNQYLDDVGGFEEVISGLELISRKVGKYQDMLLENIRPNFSKYKLENSFKNLTQLGSDNFEEIKSTNFTIDSNKKVDEFFKFVELFKTTKDLCINLNDWTEKTDIKKANNYLISKVKQEFPNIEINELLKFQSYLKYLKEGDDFSQFIRDVLNKKMPQGYEKTLPSLEVPFKFEEKADPAELHDQLFELTNYYEALTKNQFKEIEQNKDLKYYQEIAKEMYDGIKAWKQKNGHKVQENSRNIKEIEPNLERIMNTKEVETRDGLICFDPYNFEDQLVALARVRSCLSPAGLCFDHTKHYMTDVPNVFFAVFKAGEKKNIVGRVTIAVGYDAENGQQYVARVANNNYSNLPISNKTLDTAVKEYAKQLGAKFKVSGEMTVPGMGQEVYDDFMSPTEKADVITIVARDIDTRG